MIDKNGPLSRTLAKIDNVMTGVFIFEMVVKVIAMGFLFNGKGSYLRDEWCILDFVIVLVSIYSLANGDSNVSYLKAIRMLRILKPLRMISKVRSLKLAIISLIKSGPEIANLLSIVSFFIFLLAILGTTLLKGMFYRCNTDGLELTYQDKLDLIVTKRDCLNYGGVWVNPDLNFDSTPTSFITFFTVMSTEGWIDVMWDSVDAVNVGF